MAWIDAVYAAQSLRRDVETSRKSLDAAYIEAGSGLSSSHQIAESILSDAVSWDKQAADLDALQR